MATRIPVHTFPHNVWSTLYNLNPHENWTCNIWYRIVDKLVTTGKILIPKNCSKWSLIFFFFFKLVTLFLSYKLVLRIVKSNLSPSFNEKLNFIYQWSFSIASYIFQLSLQIWELKETKSYKKRDILRTFNDFSTQTRHFLDIYQLFFWQFFTHFYVFSNVPKLKNSA